MAHERQPFFKQRTATFDDFLSDGIHVSEVQVVENRGPVHDLGEAPGVIHLKDVATGGTVAKLEDPFRDRATWMAFTPSGTELVVAARYANVIHIWDLRAIRSRLKTMGLDWDWPEFPPAGRPDSSRSPFAAPPLKIQVISDGKPGQ